MTSSDHASRATAGHATRTGRVERGWFQQLQALEDAIAYRRARAAAPCPDCTASGQTCDDHACDLNLIAEYQRTAIAILDGSSQTPPAGRPTRRPPPHATKSSAPSPASSEPRAISACGP